MAGVDIGEIDCENILADVYKVVEKLLNSTDVKVYIESGSRKGDNFIGIVYRILYGSANEEKRDFKSFILKIAPQNEIRRVKFGSRGFFLREIYMYSEVLQYFNEFQLSKGVIPSENGFNEYAKCYHSIDTDKSECLFLEDLRRPGYEMIDYRSEPTTFEHVSLVMKALGKFHAISFALRDQQPERFQKITAPLQDLHFELADNSTEFRQFFESNKNCLPKALQNAEDADILEKLKKETEDFIGVGKYCTNGKNAGKFAVVCHGDAWVNNSMFRKGKDGKAVAVKLFDWQFSRYASPITDIVLYLFCCSSKELRDEHYDEFIHIYHDSLSDLIRRLGSDPSKLFSYDDMLQQLRQFAKYALVPGSILINMKTAGSEQMEDLDDVAEKMSKGEDVMDSLFMKSDEIENKYNKIARDMVVDLARLGYI